MTPDKRVENFIELEKGGRAKVMLMDAIQVARLQESNRLAWREPNIHPGTLARTELAPESAELASKSLPHMVHAPDPNDGGYMVYRIQNGNRRMYKAAFDNPKLEPVACVVFEGLDAYLDVGIGSFARVKPGDSIVKPTLEVTRESELYYQDWLKRQAAKAS
jgi:hypothetical protein